MDELHRFMHDENFAVSQSFLWGALSVDRNRENILILNVLQQTYTRNQFDFIPPTLTYYYFQPGSCTSRRALYNSLVPHGRTLNIF